MRRWPTKPLGKVCELVNGAPFKPSDWDGSGLPIVRIQNLNDPAKPFNSTSKKIAEKFRVRPGDTLLSWSGTPGTSFGCFRWNGPEGWLNQHIFNVHLNKEVLPPFFIYQVNSKLDELIGKAHGGVGLQHITKGALSSVDVTVPPLAEQERIVKLLDEADELRKLRAQADCRTAALLPALFHEMFGDPVTNPKGWPVFDFGQLLAEPLRNGLSPAKDGTHPAKVFTLSAITGERFNAAAWKDASFARLPDKDCQTSERLFLICRGNGNRELVGRGKFPSGVGENIVFPDTMVAGVPKPDMLLPTFLEEAWNLPVTRTQIASGARTTNGAFKINQTVIEQIRLLVPPLLFQVEFAQRVAEIRELEAAQAASRQRLEALFQSMLHRAFNGEL